MKIIISGTAGFIGTHTAARFLERGHTVVGFDNLSRRGARENLVWLLQRADGRLQFTQTDLRDAEAVTRLLAEHADAGVILHLGGQVAVTSSVEDPRADFEHNALGTLNVLEAVRLTCPHAVFLFSSTNKVYGGLESTQAIDSGDRYEYVDAPYGIAEDATLDFHSPYGCSKGAADQYVRDYARIYGLKTVVFRQSCIYGTRQFGVEDQGWVAWFTIAAVLGRPVTIYGDGKQIRDVLWIDDLLDLYEKAIERADEVAGHVYNVGGGPANTLSVLELLELLSKATRRTIQPRFDHWRPGDQKVFVADIRKAEAELGWSPKITPWEGSRLLVEWASTSSNLLKSVFAQESR